MDGQCVRKDVKKCQVIYRHGDYWIFCGSKFQSCLGCNGTLVTYPEIKLCVHNIAMIPHNRLLVDDSAGMLHLVDLAVGKVLISKQLTKKRICQPRFALSINGDTAFCLWAQGLRWYLVKIDLNNLDYDIYDYPVSMYAVRDVVYKSANELLVLETQTVEIDDKVVSQNQVTSAVLENNRCTTTPVHRWDHPGCGLFFDGQFVWESGYQIYDMATGEGFSLVENSADFLPQNHVALSHIYYPECRYLQLINGTANTFIDCGSRSVIAHYLNDPQMSIFSGMYTGTEFWIGKPDGIYAKPFPVIER